jgi:hypothetical protein
MKITMIKRKIITPIVHPSLEIALQASTQVRRRRIHLAGNSTGIV